MRRNASASVPPEASTAPATAGIDPALVRGILAPSLVLAFAVLVLTEMARYEFADSMHEIRIFLRLYVEDRRLAAASVLVLLAAPFLAGPLAPLSRRVLAALDRHVVSVAIAATAVMAIGALTVTRAHPLSADEAAALFQARVFAAGELTGRLPPALLPRLFDPTYIGFFYAVDPGSGRVIANYWPGFALLLAPFTALGVPWLLNPILGGLTLLALHRLGDRLFPDSRAGALALLFTLASPAFLFNAMSFYAMPAHLLAGTLYVLLLLDPSPRRLVLAGLTGGFALLLHHPFPHALFATPWIIWFAIRPDRFRRLGLLAAGYLPVLLLLGGFWAMVHRLVAPAAAADGGVALQSFIDAVRYSFILPDRITLVVRGMDVTKLVIWTAPTLLVLAAIGGFRWRRRADVRLLIASAALFLAAYCLVFFDQGAGWSSRYLHPVWLVVPLLAAGALVPGVDGAQRTARLRALITPVALASALVVNGTAAWTVRTFVTGHLAQRPTPEPDGRQVIVLDNHAGYYMRDLVINDPFLREDVIWLNGSDEPDGDDVIPRVFPGARLVRSERTGDVWAID